MALECAHCGTRCDDGATRCPKCLRTTHLVAVAAPAPPPRRAPWIVGAVGLTLAAGATVALLRARPPEPPRLPAGVAPTTVDALAVGPELQPLVDRARAERDAVARARLVATEIQRVRAAAMATDDEPTPPPRAPSLLWRVLPAARERVTELDLSRLAVAVLRAAGDAGAAVAERLEPPRADEPADPSGVRGAYVALAGDHVLEVTTGMLVGRGAVRHRALTDRALAGAVSAQAALELAEGGGPRDRALEYAHAAVEAWTDSPVPLAARARVWLLAGSTGGLPTAEADLRAAVAMREDASLHLLLARVALVRGDVLAAAQASLRAATLAPAWGSAAVAAHALRPVLEQIDAGALDACARLRAGRAPWTDDAYALCARDVAPDVRTASARRLYESSRDPLRVAFAASAFPQGATLELRAKIPARDRREAGSWLVLLGRGDLAASLAATDGGAP